ncbi:MAG: N-acetylmuramoyl-L-alanine amidase [Patulibacter minatonensis]
MSQAEVDRQGSRRWRRSHRIGPALCCAVASLTIPAAFAGSPRASDAAAAAAVLSGKVVTIDPGHNGGNASHTREINALVDAGGGRKKACDTTGTETNGGRLTEATFTLDVSLRLRALLQARGARVVMTRSTNTGWGPCVDVRAKVGNDARSDAAISVHADGGPASGRGFHVIRPKGVRGQDSALLARSDELGRRVRFALGRKGYRRATYIGRDGLDLRDDLAGLNLSRVPKVLVELGNMRSAADAALMGSPKQRERMAAALADAITNQLTR